MSTPTFAVVGAVNPGKSSIVATLAENDRVRVSPVPGETADCERFALDDLFIFFDTPGFQNAPEALAELESARNAKDPLAVFREFIARHRGERAFDAECRLLERIVAGAGIIYVVDGSRPMREINLAEMEILRLTGQPRVAVINRTSAADHVADWKSRLDQHFKIVWELNAQRASFEDRLALLDALAGLDQAWAPNIRKAVQILREDRVQKIEECAEIIAEMLCRCLEHRETSADDTTTPTRRERLEAELKDAYRRTIAAEESNAHRQLIEKFKHHLVGADADHLLDTGLFSEDTWRMLGLSTTQLAVVSGLAGGGAGVAIDVLVGGHSLGLGALIGGAIGAGGALIVGKTQPDLAVDVPLRSKWVPEFARRILPEKIRQPVSGRARVVWCAALDFPWILLDRAIGTYAYVSQRPHARRDHVTLRAAALKSILNAHGVSSEQLSDRACDKIFAAIRAGKVTPGQRSALRAKIREWLGKVGSEQIDFRAAES
ncbi:MAG: DUF3482 domain-containing protein [Chthoniobacteraceae bacterium]